ncbi:hypothetical protein [Novilysobacter erysipheiresistens]|uniref:Uncharacterized protein n=1 Tax=Novilysobacter erysipheiresistens TaxID=1749332 RepID=A0ABU7YUD0_9GAMM
MQTVARDAVLARPSNIDELIAIIQQEFPRAGIRITGRARTIRRQAELMAQRIRANRLEFLRTYRPASHIAEMDQWLLRHPSATARETVDEFERLIEQARARGHWCPTTCPIPRETSAGRSVAASNSIPSKHG